MIDIEDEILDVLSGPRTLDEILKSLSNFASVDVRAALMTLIMAGDVEWRTSDRKFLFRDV